MIDVHELAGELGVSTDVIRQTALELTGTAATGRELSRELADRVRSRLRSPGQGYSGAGGSPMFSAGTARSTAAPLGNRVVAPAFAVEIGAPRGPQQAPVQEPPARGVSGDEQPDSLADQLAAQTAVAAEAEQWRAAGLGAHDTHLIAQCQRHGITPDDLRRRVDGRTIASRLKNGESFSSVRSRIN